MRHYVLPESYDGSGSLQLSKEETKYLTRVLRKQPGDTFPGVDPQGNRVTIHLAASTPAGCVLHVTIETSQTDPTASDIPEVSITLFQCVPKANKMDLVIRQAVETGVSRIVPVLSEYTVPRFNADGFEKKQDRWYRIARQAMQQSGRRGVPEIDRPLSITKLPEYWKEKHGSDGVCLLFYEKPVSSLALHSLLTDGHRCVGICIGPEGGFSDAEAGDLLHSGLQPVYINTHVLRTETAALYAIAAVQTVILEQDCWNIRQ
jgi:16S rRNA (uracil1498-N3)-methyltransferase